MFDVHCLVHRNADLQYFPQLLKSMEYEHSAELHVLYSTENVGLGRCKGWLKGKHEWVTFVDNDDMVVPGIFHEVSKVINKKSEIWFTDEILIDANNNYIKNGWSSNPEIYPEIILRSHRLDDNSYPHHLLFFHRDCITKDFISVISEIFWNPENYAIQYIVNNGGTYQHIPLVGYCWRIHNNNGTLFENTPSNYLDYRRYYVNPTN